MAQAPEAVPTRPAQVPENPAPLDPPMVPFALVGMGVWLVLGVVALAGHGWLTAHHHQNWLWICVAGFLLGLPGLAMMSVHDRNRRIRRRRAGLPD